MEEILKDYDDMRIMRMVKKQLIYCEKELELLNQEYGEKDDQLLALGIKKEITKRDVADEEVDTLVSRLDELKKKIEMIEEDRSSLSMFNVYSRK